MKEKLKSFLEEQFKTIPPTQAAMEYRNQILVQLLDRVQELKIKGISDENLIYSMVVEELGNFQDKLQEFANRQIKNKKAKRNTILGSIIALSTTILLALTYVLVGVFTKVWHPTWLIMVGGIFVGVIVASIPLIIRYFSKKKYILSRTLIALCEILFSVFVFLVLQIVFNLSGSWMTFLAMVALISGIDTIIAFITSSKLRWVELPMFIEIFFVMLYVILGVSITSVSIWHPAWVLCLIGVVAAIIEILVFAVEKTKKKNSMEDERIADKYLKTDESYWTKWND